MTLYPTDRVEVFAHWHSMRGQRGRVTSVRPLYVHFDGDRLPMRIEEHAVVRLESEQHMVAGE